MLFIETSWDQCFKKSVFSLPQVYYKIFLHEVCFGSGVCNRILSALLPHELKPGCSVALVLSNNSQCSDRISLVMSFKKLLHSSKIKPNVSPFYIFFSRSVTTAVSKAMETTCSMLHSFWGPLSLLVYFPGGWPAHLAASGKLASVKRSLLG